MAIRDHDGLPLLLRPYHDRAVDARGSDADGVVQDPQRPLSSPDQVLRQALPHQLRPRRRHRNRAGVPVRYELVGVLAIRRRHLRRPAGPRGPPRLLHGVDLHRPVDLRVGQASQGSPPGLHLPDRPWHHGFRGVHPRGQLVDAEPRGGHVQPRHPSRRVDRFWCRSHQPGLQGNLPSPDFRVLHGRRSPHRRNRLLAPGKGRQGSSHLSDF